MQNFTDKVIVEMEHYQHYHISDNVAIFRK